MNKSMLFGALAAAGLSLGAPGRADAQVTLSFGTGGIVSPYGYGYTPGFGGYYPYTSGYRGYSTRYGSYPYYGNRSFYGSYYNYPRSYTSGYRGYGNTGYRNWGTWRGHGRR